MKSNDTFEAAWRELEEAYAPYRIDLTPEEEELLESARAAQHPALKELSTYVDCEEFTFYDVNQCLQKALKKVIRRLEEEKLNPQRGS